MELNKYQSAEPGQCGSCQHYKPRENADGYGFCTFRFPPKVIVKTEWGGDGDIDPRTARDTDGCSLYQSKTNADGTPTQFMQKTSWLAGKSTREPI
jgi:hypothetical protein